MQKSKQAGKGFSGFITGILLATAVIAAVLFLLNKNRSNDFKEQNAPAERENATEILSPSAEPTPPSVQQASEETFIVIEPEEQPSSAAGGTADESRRSRETAAKPRRPEAVKESTRSESAKPAPTPEQILNSGSIEKARRQAQEEQAERRRAQAALNGEAGKQEKHTQATAKAVVQAGSYSTRNDADAQRAKLAMLGISSHIAGAEVGGKTVYRVQTAPLGAEAAAEVRRTLQKNGIDSFVKQVR